MAKRNGVESIAVAFLMLLSAGWTPARAQPLGDPLAANAFIKDSAPMAQAKFGVLCVNGQTMVVATGPHTFAGAGGDAVCVFTHEGGEWIQEARFRGANTEGGDFFWVPRLSGDTLVVGAFSEDSSATGVNGDGDDNSASSAGAAYVFQRSSGAWLQDAYLKASNTDASDGFGWAVDINGDRVVVGATGESSSANAPGGDETNNALPGAGAAYVFVRDAGGCRRRISRLRILECSIASDTRLRSRETVCS